MRVCVACRSENPDRARFCMECGIRLAEVGQAAGGSRRTVTILFTDIVGSTELGEQLDPETLRAILSEYFETMQTAIERHGGRVEKFIGDAIMAVFGFGAIHEDDALRAVRAVAEMRTALAAFNTDLQARRGIEIATRTGLNTGEVMAGDPSLQQTMVTGDSVNTAARLEQAAGRGETLMSEATWRLVRNAVTVEPTLPLAAKGKAAPIPAVRFLELNQDAPRHGAASVTPLIGRASELEQLIGTFRTVTSTRTPAMLLVLGPAGIGKSRLTDALLAAVAGEARVVRGHCLAYGDGVSYWPIREIVHAAAGIQDGDRLDAGMGRLEELLAGVADGDVVVPRLATAIGLADALYPQDEIFWAIRRTLEHLAATRPLVVVVEDIHWADAALLELLAHVLRNTRNVPMLFVCPARPDVLDRLPPGIGDALNVTVLRLDGLASDATRDLFASIPGGHDIPGDLRDRILATVEGNPLFLEEMVRMVVDDREASGARETTLPPTIQALLAARVDQLPADERDVAKRASIVGRVFEEPAVAALSPGAAEPWVTTQLLALVRREVIDPTPSDLSLIDAYQFRHVLLRDAAYEALAKAERAELHRRFADWLEQVAGDRLIEYQEILGYHLGQAYRYRVELRENDDTTRSVGRRAARHLAAAGKRAMDRGEGATSVRLLEHAEALPAGEDPPREQVLHDLGRALQLAGRHEDAARTAAEALATADAAGNRRIAARARLLLLELAQTSRKVGLFDPAVRSEIALALTDAEASKDNLALAEAHSAMGGTDFQEGLAGDYDARLALARDYAEAAGERAMALGIETNRLIGLWMSPMPRDEVRARLVAHAERAASYPLAHAEALSLVGRISAQLGETEAGMRLIDEAIQALVDIGSMDGVPHMRSFLAQVQWASGDTEAAEATFHRAMDEAQADANLFFVSFVSAHLDMLLVELDRYDEASAALDEGAIATNAITRSRMLGARARIAAARGQSEPARELIGEALSMTEHWPWPITRAEALLNAAHVSRALGDEDAALGYANEAVTLTQALGDVPYTRRIERFLASMA